MFLKLIVVLFFSLIYGERQNNVCNTYEAYFTDINHNPNCWFNNDVNASPERLAKNYGFLLETHLVHTEDGYILSTFRLKRLNGLYGKEVIFLQHGLSTDSTCFMANGNKSLAFFLANQGYDIWLGNFRGTQFSSHEYLTEKDSKYWDFSFHENGLYDLPANFKYITSKTKQKIIYIGHSMGSTSVGVYASIKAEEAKKFLKHLILIAGTFYITNSKGITSYESILFWENVLKLLSTMNLNVMLTKDSRERQIITKGCMSSLEYLTFCHELIQFFGGSKDEISPEMFSLQAGLLKNLGFKSALHYMQCIKTGDFKMYDYGPEQNILRYNSTIPPAYNLSDILITSSWIYGKYDIIATKVDNYYSLSKLKKSTWEIYEIPTSHFGFVTDKNVDKYFLPLLLKIIYKHTAQ